MFIASLSLCGFPFLDWLLFKRLNFGIKPWAVILLMGFLLNILGTVSAFLTAS
jgi:hypothetical protein